jgi:hypothetical protein
MLSRLNQRCHRTQICRQRTQKAKYRRYCDLVRDHWEMVNDGFEEEYTFSWSFFTHQRLASYETLAFYSMCQK